MDVVNFTGKNGRPMKFKNLAKTNMPFNSSFSFEDRRYILFGRVSIDKTIGSYKYDQELKIDVWTDQPVILEGRVNTKWNRIEIILPLDVGTNLLKQAMTHLNTQNP